MNPGIEETKQIKLLESAATSPFLTAPHGARDYVIVVSCLSRRKIDIEKLCLWSGRENKIETGRN